MSSCVRVGGFSAGSDLIKPIEIFAEGLAAKCEAGNLIKTNRCFRTLRLRPSSQLSTRSSLNAFMHGFDLLENSFYHIFLASE